MNHDQLPFLNPNYFVSFRQACVAKKNLTYRGQIGTRLGTNTVTVLKTTLFNAKLI